MKTRPENPKIVASIEARMNSSRLPGKVLKTIQGETMLEVMIKRVKSSCQIDDIIIATTDNPLDDPIEELCKMLNVKFFRGSEVDVLKRVLEAQKSLGSDIVVELTGDCPLIDPEIIDRTIEMFLKEQPLVDYATSIQVPNRLMPDGMDVDVFWLDELDAISKTVFDKEVREHISPYFWQSGNFACAFLNMQKKHIRNKFLRITLDTSEDFERIKDVHEALKYKGIYSLEDILLYFDSKN